MDLLISEDKKIHIKASALNISDKVFTINSFLEKIYADFPGLVTYPVLGIHQKFFGELNLEDPFFDTLKEDYPGFEGWFNKKANEKAYVTLNGENGKLLSFLYLKVEDTTESYNDIVPAFSPKKRLKVGTLKVVSNGFRLGERFMKVIFDNAVAQKVEEIYVTVFDKQKHLITVLEEWGFKLHGTKGANEELVYVRDFSRRFDPANPKKTYPYLGLTGNVFLVPIYPEYHTNLLPDSFLKTESPDKFSKPEPHRNALSKVYICRSVERGVNKGDVLVFYRTAETGKSGHYSSVITTIAVVEEKIDGIKTEEEFLRKYRKRSVFNDEQLKSHWNWNTNFRPFVINFLYVYSFQLGKRMTRKALLDLGIITGAKGELRGLTKITTEQFVTILKEISTNESIIVH